MRDRATAMSSMLTAFIAIAFDTSPENFPILLLLSLGKNLIDRP